MKTVKRDRLEAIKVSVEEARQSHVLSFYEGLNEGEQACLLDQIESVDWKELAGLVDTHVLNIPAAAPAADLAPPSAYPWEPTPPLRDVYSRGRNLGEQLVREGKVSVFSVAGGQGSRLGHDAPKGTFPATPIRHQSIFGVIAESILKAQVKCGGLVPWYVMTSTSNDGPTRTFFAEQDYFGLDPDQVMTFPQGMMPAMDAETGRVLLASRDSLALSPNGHGGSLRALIESGALDDMYRRGVEQISYTQVDNPLARVVDPLFLGLHAAEGCGMSSKALAKISPEEKVGVFASSDGTMVVIEYSDMPNHLAARRDGDGQLSYRFGSIAIHAIAVELIASVGDRGRDAMPFHRAVKKVEHVDLRSGTTIRPDIPNAVKLEMFVFDALPLCDRSIVYETDRIEEFAPIKNADAASPEASVDSPFTSCMIQVERAGRWLESCGVAVPRDDRGRVNATIEISPRTAVEPGDLDGVSLPCRIAVGEEVLL